MTCNQCQEQMPHAHTLTGDALKIFEAHLASCQVCQKDHQFFLQIDNILTAQPLKQPGPDFTTQVLTQVTPTHNSVYTPGWPSVLATAISLVALWSGIVSGLESVTLEGFSFYLSILDFRPFFETTVGSFTNWVNEINPSMFGGVGLEVGLIMCLLVITWGFYLSVTD